MQLSGQMQNRMHTHVQAYGILHMRWTDRQCYASTDSMCGAGNHVDNDCIVLSDITYCLQFTVFTSIAEINLTWNTTATPEKQLLY